MNSTSNLFLEKAKELYLIHEKVKSTIIYAENFDPKRELYIAPINQLRSVLDHLLKAATSNSGDIDYEIKEAKEHLDRAGYDAFEILASNLGITIVEKLTPYSTETLTNVFPKYYTEIKPKLVEIKAKLAEIRTNKKTSTNGNNDSFNSYYSQIEILMSFDKQVNCVIPSLEEFHQKKRLEELKNQKEARKEKNKDRIFNVFVCSLITGIVVGLVVYFITK